MSISDQERVKEWGRELDRRAHERHGEELMEQQVRASGSSSASSGSSGSIGLPAPIIGFLFKALILALPFGIVWNLIIIDHPSLGGHNWGAEFHSAIPLANWAHWAPWARFLVESEVLGLIFIIGAPLGLAYLAAYYSAMPFGGLASNGLVPEIVAIFVGFASVALCYVLLFSLAAFVLALIVAPMIKPIFNWLLKRSGTQYRAGYWTMVLIIMAYWVFKERLHRLLPAGARA